MSVYKKRPIDAFYWYDFELGGERFRENTFKTTKREAKAVELEARADAKRQGDAKRETAKRFKGGEMRFGDAVASYMDEHGRFLSAASDEQAYMRWLVEHVGADTLLSAIDDGFCKRLVSLRRLERATWWHRTRKIFLPVEPARLVSPATVNRSVTAPLRRVLRYVAKYKKVRTEIIAWSDLMLKEAAPRKREASIGEERALIGKLAEGYADAGRFTFLAACRHAEVVSLRWPNVDFFAREFTVLGKGEKFRTLPMTPELEKLLRAQLGNHPEFVFTYAAQRADKAKGLVRGKRYPITYAGLKSMMRRKVVAAGLADFSMHDIRRTRATRIWRQRGDAVAVQAILGHTELSTTMRYIGAKPTDIRAAMESAEAAEMAALAAVGDGAVTGTPHQSPHHQTEKTVNVLNMRRN